MAQPLFGSSSKSGAPLFGSGASSSPHPHDHGVGGFLKHLGTDVRDMAVGLPAGLVMTAKHPVRSLEEMGKTTWHDWSPLFQGHPGEFSKNFYAHPLGPILDVASVFSLGAGGAGKIAKIATAGEVRAGLETAVAAGERAPMKAAIEGARHPRLAQLGRPKYLEIKSPTGAGAPMYKALSKNPLSQLRQTAARNLGHRIGEASPKWGSRFTAEGEYARLLAKESSKRAATAGSIRRSVTAEIGRRVDAETAKAAVGTQMAGFMQAGKKIATDPRAVYDVTEKVMHDNARATAMKIAPDEMGMRNGVVVAPKGFKLMKAEPKKFQAVTAEGVEIGMRTWAKRNTTRLAEHAARDEHGYYLAVRDGEMQALGHEAANASKTLHALYTKPTQVWKWTVLATRPAFFVNNVVGNLLMATAALGPAEFARATVDTLRNAHGVAGKDLTGLDRKMARAIRHSVGAPGDAVDQLYMGPHRLGFGQEQMGSGPKLSPWFAKHGASQGLQRSVRAVENGFLPITHRVAESWVRRVLLDSYLRKSEEVRIFMKGGNSFDEAVQRASKSPAFRARIEGHVGDALGDYHHFNKLEKSIRQIVPFYSWDRAIMRHTAHLVKERPLTATVLADMGEQGTNETQKLLGDIPQFMKSYMPLSLVGIKGKPGGRVPLLATTGVNPYATVPQVVDFAQALVSGQVKPGEALASQINPIATGVIESATGQSLLSGARKPHRPGGIIGNVAASAFEGTPPVALLERVIQGTAQPHPNKATGKTKPFLFTKDLRHLLEGYAGAPVKLADLQSAAALAAKDSGKKVGRRQRKKKNLF